MSFRIVIECPTHPAYAAKGRPPTFCKLCSLAFDVRNNTNKVLSTPPEDRIDLNERIIKAVE